MNEATFLSSILEEPAGAATTWLVLADWLEEQGDARAELVRLCHDRHYRLDLEAGARDERVRFLLASGMNPCVPEWSNSVGMRFALIPAGKFLMGSPDDEAERFDDEGPQHEVELTQPFSLGVFPVTQEQYKKVTGKNPSYFTKRKGGGPAHPVENVSWEDAVAFCGKLSARPEETLAGRVYRLPSEAEWEYACRAGASSSMPFSFGGSLSSTQANFDGNYPYGGAAAGPYLGRTTPVGSYRPNAFGLCDMHGNVWEWCQDWYGDYPSSYIKDPIYTKSGAGRVLRGGSWIDLGMYCRVACRGRGDPGGCYSLDGFRVVCVAAPRT